MNKFDIVEELEDATSKLLLQEPDLEDVLKQLEQAVRSLEDWIYSGNEVEL